MLQFSLKTLLAATLFIALGCGAIFVLPGWVGLMIVLAATLGLAAPLVAGVIYGRDNGKAFAIGGLSAYVAWAVALGNAAGFDFPSSIGSEPYRNLVELLVTSDFGLAVGYFLLCWPLVVLCGLIGVAIRRRSLRSAPKP